MSLFQPVIITFAFNFSIPPSTFFSLLLFLHNADALLTCATHAKAFSNRGKVTISEMEVT